MPTRLMPLLPATGPLSSSVEPVSRQSFTHELCSGSWTLVGGQITSWAPVGHSEVLWSPAEPSPSPGVAARGGIPICWPWFGPAPVGDGKHGLVRTRLWSLLSLETLPQFVRVRLGLSLAGNEEARWPHRANLEVEATFGAELAVSLTTTNADNRSFSYTEALHTYLRVGDWEQAQVEGPFGRLGFGDEVDEVWEHSPAGCALHDPVLQRRIDSHKSGSQSTVIWNPGKAKAAALTDLGLQGHRHFVCVESGNVRRDQVTLAPGESHTLGVRYVVSVAPAPVH